MKHLIILLSVLLFSVSSIGLLVDFDFSKNIDLQFHDTYFVIEPVHGIVLISIFLFGIIYSSIKICNIKNNYILIGFLITLIILLVTGLLYLLNMITGISIR